ncbi:hypothetical protein FB451DRAFT_182093 [Mycena latifolia]|nr:hypothetical protein FB451DRAFT_116268 [Mycena latifolia]KAJ7478154.1 hypothetical protein FB451DRAFT_182093 [Mycena latifolia]
MKGNTPATSKARYPGNKRIVRKNLTAQGVFQEIHCDGHEKLSSLDRSLQSGTCRYIRISEQRLYYRLSFGGRTRC